MTSAYDLERLEGLRRARRRATGMLIGVAVVFVATFFMGDATWVGFLRTTAEASMIGGLADWFAVTALFRHPLGIPIPHTAIIPRSKAGLARSLGEFVRNNFLSPDQLVERIEGADLPQRLGRWLASDDHADLLAGHLATTLGTVVEGLDREEIETSIEEMVRERLHSLPMAEMVGRGMEAAIAEGQHHQLMTAGIAGIAAALDENEATLRAWARQESPWWVPEAVDDAVFDRAYAALRTFVGDLARQPDHEIRRSLDDRLAELARRLRTDPDLGRLVTKRVDELAAHPEVRAWARGLWSQVARALTEAADRHDSTLRLRIAAALRDLGHRLTTDPVLQERVETWVKSLAPLVAVVGQRELGDLIAVTVDRWDPEDTSRRLELWMGRDLQFVRINGTVVGGLAGLAIHTIVFLSGAG